MLIKLEQGQTVLSQRVEEQKQDIVEFKQEFQNFKEEQYIAQAQCKEISNRVKSLGTKLLGGKKKLSLKSRYKVLPQVVQQIKNTKDNISILEIEKEQLMNTRNKVVDGKGLSVLNQEISYHYKRLGELENFADSLRGEIKNLESDMFVLVDLGDSYLSTHQKIQLLGGGVKKSSRNH